MTLSLHTRAVRFLIQARFAVGISVLATMDAAAQQRFTTQVLVVPALRGPDRGVAGKVSDILRSRISAAFSRSELRVVSGGDLDDWLRLSGFEANVALTEVELRDLAKKFRADERITGTVSRSSAGFHIEASLTLVRDLRLTQPLVADGASVNEAAEAVARGAIAARRQFAPLRQCENANREAKPSEAVTAAIAAVAAYPSAVPARMCLLNALSKTGAGLDTLVSVARAVLSVAPANPVALEHLAVALDAQGKPELSGPMWARLLATDSTSEDLVDRVVTALSRGGNAAIAQPLIDRGTAAHPDNLPLLKLQWLVHLATNDWAGATAAGEKLVTRDAATQTDPDFYARLAGAYRSDSQPSRALSVAAAGVAKFPRHAPLYIVYLQLLRAENDGALTRGLATFPENAEMHVIAAQTRRSAGDLAGALTETKRALARNPRLPRGYLQLAQLELDVGEPDSALVALELAPKNGEEPATVARFALARGNEMYKAASASQKREDFQRAVKFLSLATKLGPTPESKFLLGASALSISQSAATEAPATKSCGLSRLAESSLVEAEMNLASGGSVAPDAAKQFLEYAAKLRPYVADQVRSFC